MPATSNPEPTARDKALADPAVPALLKELAQRILPQRQKDEFLALVHGGALDPLTDCAAQPLFSPVSQVMGLPRAEADEWIRMLFDKEPAKILEAKCPCWGFRNGRFSTDPNHRDPYYAVEIETPMLLSVLAARDTPVLDVAKIAPHALSAAFPDRYGNNAGEPLLHQLFNSKELAIATFDALEQLTGGVDFLFIKNSRGETLFHRIASMPGAAEDQLRLDVASWMLQRRPDLVNEPDRFGWTPLDRLVSQSRGNVDTSMGRLLIVEGARLAKQIAPAFTLAAALEQHSGSRLDKPAPRKPNQLPKP